MDAGELARRAEETQAKKQAEALKASERLNAAKRNVEQALVRVVSLVAHRLGVDANR